MIIKMFMSIEDIEKEIENLTTEDMLKRCKNEHIFISEEELSLYMEKYNVSKNEAIKDIYIGMLMYYQEQEEALQELYSDITRSSY